MDFNIEEFLATEELSLIDEASAGREGKAAQEAESGILDGVAQAAGQKTRSLQQMMDGYAKALKDFALKPDGTPTRMRSAQFKGFAAEEYFKLTAKINGLADGTWSWQFGVYTYGELPGGSVLSRIDMQYDIVGFSRKWPWENPERVANYQAKIHNDAKQYKKDWAKKKYEGVSKVGGAGQGVNDTVRIPGPKGEILSDTGTPMGFTNLADEMKAQAVPPYDHREEKLDSLSQHNIEMAVKAGAVTGLICSSVSEIIQLWQNKENLTKEDFVDAAVGILCGTVEGGVRGGAIVGSVRVFSKVIGKEIAENSLEAVVPMALANTTVDFAKDLYACLVTKEIDKDDLLCKTVSNAYSSTAHVFGGWALGKAGEQAAWAIKALTASKAAETAVSIKSVAATTASIGSAFGPIGAVIGAVVGSYVINAAVTAIERDCDEKARQAVNDCIMEMQSNLELYGFDRYQFYVDGLDELSETQLSFKMLIPCYNLLFDIKEYNYRKKKLREVREIALATPDWDSIKKAQINKIEQAITRDIRVLEESFLKKKQLMENGFQGQMRQYLQASYQEYLSVSATMTSDMDSLYEQLCAQNSKHLTAIIELQKKRDLDTELNQELSDLMANKDSADLLRPFVAYIMDIMKADEVAAGKQYLSVEDALSFVQGES